MAGLYASVPEHVSSAIRTLENAFCTNTNAKVTIEDATVRVQSGAMQFMLGQARRGRLHSSPAHSLAPLFTLPFSR